MVSLEKWWCVALCISSWVSAQAPSPVVMPFPVEVKRTPAALTQEDRDALQREYTRLLRLSGARVPDFARFDAALNQLKRKDCEREDECLSQLAKKAESLYALFASIDYTLEGAVWVSGRVVRDDGKVVRPTQTVKVKELPYKEGAMKALEQLFAELKLEELPAERPVEVKEPIKVAVAPVVPVVIKVEDPGAGQRSIGRTVLIIGIAGAAAGGALLAVGQGLGMGLTPTDQLNLPREQLATFKSARTLTTGGLVGVAAGGAVAVAGAVIWGLAPSAPAAVKVSAIAGPDGAMVSIEGAF